MLTFLVSSGLRRGKCHLTQHRDCQSVLPLGDNAGKWACGSFAIEGEIVISYSSGWYKGESYASRRFTRLLHWGTTRCGRTSVEWVGSFVSGEMASVWPTGTGSFWGWFVSHLKYAFNLDLWPVGEAAAFFYDLKCLVHVKTCLVSLFILNQENVRDHIWNSSSSVHLATSPLAPTSPWLFVLDVLIPYSAHLTHEEVNLCFSGKVQIYSLAALRGVCIFMKATLSFHWLLDLSTHMGGGCLFKVRILLEHHNRPELAKFSLIIAQTWRN